MLDSKFWAKYFRVYDALNQLIPYQDLMSLFVEKTKELARGEEILDLGSGTGNLYSRLEAEGYILKGVDFSEEGIALHKEKKPNGEVIHADITKILPFHDEAFDGIVTNNVIYTLSPEEQIKVFKEVYRKVKPSGFLISSNLAPDFRAGKIYNAHIKQSLIRKGLLKTLLDVIRFSIPTVKIFYYNFLIKRQNMGGGYHFLDEATQERLISDAGFHILGSTRTYGGQAVCTWARKD